MSLYSWDTVKKEVLNDKIARRFVTGEKVMVAQLFIAKDGLVPRHQHESEQVTMAMEGALAFDLGGKEIILRPGDVLVIPSNVPHSARAVADYFGLDIFSPIRMDWLTGQDDYLRKK